MNAPTILIIDDEPDNFDVISILLNDQEYQLHYIGNAAEVIDSLEIIQPDLILLDVMMPGINGVELCRQIRAVPKWQSIPITMVTALTRKEDLARCLNAGADDFISKPLNGLELRARVHSMLRIKHQHDHLQTLLKFREDMVHMLIHDLRNRLTDVLLGVEFLEMDVEPVIQERLAKIYKSAQGLQLLIDDLLKIALLESGNIRLNRANVDIRQLVNAVINNFRTIANQKSQSLISLFADDLVDTIFIDETLMYRVLDNLLSNAVKFSPSHSKIVVKVTGSQPDTLIIQVIDSGPGVPHKLRQQIFEKYEIGTLMPNVSQIGLGLALCKMIVETHQGNIFVKSNHPKGSIFEINLAHNPAFEPSP
ncbi:hybrid sensor histidine kinase/response regulator [Leptolyngbyaceae cyanobacterium CCMR0082]|uniref:histidine kinase n=1 Tax=Adonisia turfae CCMR0082 TaxID=2304604 RepID=A0A6M0S6L6_9CYAN|nr:hybrid sensor histidine kinase/response regulator [Adonisia turfae]MDV3348904.1 hybrid sensor histidine kinase/response regulator [Leptothoe sp. LEGE 181152]NEZ64010.1 hybrid sensor histidine kinase/response regulator [Adonisia turfae CCMR0082]